MNKIIILWFLLLQSVAVTGSISEESEQAIKQCYGNNINLTKHKYAIPPEIKLELEKESNQKFFSEHIYVWKVEKADKVIGYAVLDNVYGKTQPITFLVNYNSMGEIISSVIIKYREQFGGAIKSEKWNSQFKGKTEESYIEIGKDIDSISGATISSHAVTRGIKKLAKLINIIQREMQ